MPGSHFDQTPRGCEVVSDGLFNQHVDAVFKQRASHFGMMRSRNRDHGGVDFAGQFRGRSVDGAAVFGGGSGGTIGVAIHHAGEFAFGDLLRILRWWRPKDPAPITATRGLVKI